MNKEAIDKNPIIRLALEFPLEVISFCKFFESQKKYLIAGLFLTPETAIGANIIEAKIS
jgi:hypothetical protein